ncbi:MAG TPA: hypothetical protein VGX48_11940 [Pyrinomonadaceae bacterium]|jgi:hypothetical protein|nr:hypothetical protein [Pyrinomonadaceae bacterium]
MDLLSLLLTAALAAGTAGANTGGADETRATIIDTGAPAASEQPPPPDDEVRSSIIDIG